MLVYFYLATCDKTVLLASVVSGQQKTRSPAITRIGTGCHLPSRSSKVDDFYVIQKPIRDFLLILTIPYLSLFPRYGHL